MVIRNHLQILSYASTWSSGHLSLLLLGGSRGNWLGLFAICSGFFAWLGHEGVSHDANWEKNQRSIYQSPWTDFELLPDPTFYINHSFVASVISNTGLTDYGFHYSSRHTLFGLFIIIFDFFLVYDFHL